jgi:hypothetical protein
MPIGDAPGALQAFTQFRQAQVVRGRTLACCRGRGGGVADERRRDLVAFTKPELSARAVAPHARVGDLADHGFFKLMTAARMGSLPVAVEMAQGRCSRWWAVWPGPR